MRAPGRGFKWFSRRGARPGELALERYDDDLVVTDPADVVAYITSSPPGSGASAGELDRLEAAAKAAFASGGGTMKIGKDTGRFMCRGPQTNR